MKLDTSGISMEVSAYKELRVNEDEGVKLRSQCSIGEDIISFPHALHYYRL